MFNSQAERAFSLADGTASKLAHQNMNVSVLLEDGHWKPTNKYFSSAVCGGIYGILSTLAPIAAVTAAQLDNRIALIVGLSTLFAGAVILSVGDYISNASAVHFAQSQRARERWELDNFPEGEKKEMVEIYEHRGFTQEQATQLIDIMATNHQFFVDHMLVYELDIMPPDPRFRPVYQAFASLCSFLCLGLFVLIPFLASSGARDPHVPFYIACGVASPLVFILGLFKGRFAMRTMAPMGFYSLLHAVVAVSLAFLVGHLAGSLSS
jgi:VIT1/CCC1 family predicted Fe2+/Mn2+ transporter